jgi:hypothetical protein
MTNARVSVVAIAFAGGLIIAVPASAQPRRPVPSFETQVVPAHVRPGQTTRLRLKVILPEGLHVQSNKPRDEALIPTVLTVPASAGLSIVRRIYPKASDLDQPGGGEPLAGFSGTFFIDVDVTVPSSQRPGTFDVPGELRYQSCTVQVCFPPSRAEVSWRVRADSGR